MGSIIPVRDFFNDEELKAEFDNAAVFNAPTNLRPIIIPEVEEKKRGQIETRRILVAFMDRMDYLLNSYYKQKNADLLAIYNERAILDILELYYGGRIHESNAGMITGLVNDLGGWLNNTLRRNPMEILKGVEYINEPITDEKQMDEMLIAMLALKLNNQGRVQKRFSSFVIRQCFYPDSVIMKNPDKYKEVVYRYLLEFAKGEAIDTNYKLERELGALLEQPILYTGMPHGRYPFPKMRARSQNSKREPNYLDDMPKSRLKRKILKCVQELNRVGWVYNNKTVERLAFYLRSADLTEAERNTIRTLLEEAYCSKEHDNSPIIVLSKEIDAKVKDARIDGFTKRRFIAVREGHVSNIFSNDSYYKLGVIETLYHEITHVAQNINYKKPKTYLSYLQLKLNILIEKGIIDYEAIYGKETLHEREAFRFGAAKAIEFAKRNRLDVDLTSFMLETRKQEIILNRLLEDAVPVRIERDGLTVERQLSDIFDEVVEEDTRSNTRKELEEDWGEEWIEFLDKNAVPKYLKNPDKEVELDDYEISMKILTENPVLRLEYNDEGKKRTFSNYLANVKNLIFYRRFLGSDRKTKLYFDGIEDLMTDIAANEFMTPRNLPEILYGLSKDDLADSIKDKSSNYKMGKIISNLTSGRLKDVFKEATDEIEFLPRDTIEQSLQMCKLIHLFEENAEDRQKRIQFFEALEEIRPQMQAFEQRAKGFLGDEEHPGNGNSEGRGIDD